MTSKTKAITAGLTAAAVAVLLAVGAVIVAGGNNGYSSADFPGCEVFENDDRVDDCESGLAYLQENFDYLTDSSPDAADCGSADRYSATAFDLLWASAWLADQVNDTETVSYEAADTAMGYTGAISEILDYTIETSLLIEPRDVVLEALTAIRALEPYADEYEAANGPLGLDVRLDAEGMRRDVREWLSVVTCLEELR